MLNSRVDESAGLRVAALHDDDDDDDDSRTRAYSRAALGADELAAAHDDDDVDRSATFGRVCVTRRWCDERGACQRTPTARANARRRRYAQVAGTASRTSRMRST